MNSKIIPIVVGILGVGALIAWFRTQTKKAINMAEYSISALKVREVKVLETVVRVSLLVKNPSDLAMKINAFKVEIYTQNSDGTKKLLSQTDTSSLTIPANQTFLKDIDFRISNTSLVSIIGNVLSDIISGKTTLSQLKSKITDGTLRGKISILIKSEILGTYLEKEIKY